MSARRRASIVAIGALIGALLVPMAGAGAATAATLEPSGLDTGFQIDGDKTGGTPPATFDWASFLTPNPPSADGSFTFTPTGAYTTAEGNASTGILDASFEWDNGALADACPVVGEDATGSPGTQTPNTIPWAPGSAQVNAKGDLCSTASAYEIVTDAQDVRHAILYSYWTRQVGNGSLSVLQLLEGPAAGRCDDVLVVFDYESNLGTVQVHFREWVPTSGDGCTNPNGVGTWVATGEAIDFDWAVGIRTEGPPIGNQPQATFGEFAVDLTAAGLFSPDECTTFTASTMLSRTGSDFGAQTQDYLEPSDPLVVSNCGGLTVTKEVEPAGIVSDDRFDYVVDRAGGGIVLPESDETSIEDDLGIGETDTFTDVLGADDYQLSEIVAEPWTLQSMVCTAEQPGTGEPVTFILDEPTDTFTVYLDTVTDCVITNATSTVTVTKQTLPDGSDQEFTFDIGGQPAILSDGESITLPFTPGSSVDISETIPSGWVGTPDITCTDAAAVIDEPGASARVTTVAGQDVSCTFTNTELANIVVVKQAFGTPADTTFDFVGDWTTGVPALPAGGVFSINAATGDGASYSQTFTGVVPGEYSVTEPAGQNGTLFGSLVCMGSSADVVYTGSTADFSVAPGGTVTCTYVNVAPGQFVVIKETVPAGYDQPFAFTFAGPPATDFTLNAAGTDTRTFEGLAPGDYVVTEGANPPNWTLTAIDCTVNGSTVPTDLGTRTATVTLPANGAGACVFTNTATPASVTVTKTVAGVADDYAWSFGFTLDPADGVTPGGPQTISGTGATSGTATWNGLVPGETYTLTENPTPGWTAGTLTCEGLTDLNPALTGFQFDAAPGQVLACAITNTATPADLTVTKTVEGVTADYPWEFGFTLNPADGVTPSGSQTVSGVGPSTDTATWEGLVPGETYTLTEDPAPGWTAGTLTCEGLTDLDPALAGFQFEAAPGQVLACAITNTAAPIDLDVTKTALGGDDTFQFVLTPIDPAGDAQVVSTATEDGTGVATFTGLVAGGTYSLSETDQPGWLEGELTCTVTHADSTTDDIDIAGFTVLAGDSIACAVTNEAPGQIVVVKQAFGTPADTMFNFVGDWTTGVPALPAGGVFSINAATGDGASYSQTFTGVVPGEYSVTEPAGQNGTLFGSLVCTGSSAEVVYTGSTADFSVAPGGTVTCTYVNVAPGQFVVIKETVPAGYDQPFAFTFAGPPATDFTLNAAGTDTRTFEGLAPGDYVVTEGANPPNWTLTAIDCTVNGSAVPTDLGTRTATVTLPANGAGACVFTNTATPASVTVTKTVAGVADDYAWSFGFTLDPADGVTPGGPQTISGTGATSGTATWNGLVPGETYTLTENPAPGWTAGTLTCEGLTDLDPALAGFQFEAAPGLALTCAVTNTATPASVTVTKAVVDVAADYAWSFGFTLDPAAGDPPVGSQTISGVGPASGTATWNGLVPGEAYTLTEDPAPGWTAGTLTCEGLTDLDTVAPGFTFEAAPGQVLACAVTNTAAPANVTVTKTVAGVTGDYAWSFGFTLDPAAGVTPGAAQTISGVGPTSGTATWNGLVPGETYTLAENPTPDWTAGTLTCEGIADLDDTADSVTFIATPGLALECAITNTAAPASVTVDKTVVGVTDDYAWSFGFTLDPADGVTPGASQDVTGTGPSTESATWDGLIPGETYTISENPAPGWVVGDLTCEGLTDLDPALAGFQFEAAPGQTLACAITNTAAPIDLDVTKTALGGDATFQFTLTPIDPAGEAQIATVVTEGGSGVATFTGLVAGGTYSLSETDQPGWTEGTLSCTVTHADSTPAPVDIAGFTLEPGDSISCAVENQAVGRIVIVKNVEGADGTFDFTGTWLEPADFSIETTDGTGSSTFEDVPAGSYAVVETVPVGYDNTAVTCEDGDPDGLPSSSEGLAGAIALDPGETVICTFTNTQWGTILVDKTTLPAGSDQEFDFVWGPDGEAFSLTDEAEAYSTGLVAPGEYTIAETSEIDGWTLTGLTCTGGDGEPVVDGSSVTVQVPLQETVFCEFTNALQAPLLFDKALVGSPQKQSDGSYLVDYEITVENPGGLADVYDLDDRLQFGAGITVVSATVASLNGVATDPTWNGTSAVRVATDVSIPGGVVHTYTVTARAALPSAIAIDIADCTAAAGEGTGLLNTATLTYTDGQADDSACAPVPASLPPTGAMVTGLWLGLGLLLGGIVLFLLRRRNRVS